MYHHNEVTFSILYAWSENFMLPLSHDEVVHGKGSLVNKFPGDRWQKMATLRALYGFMWAHPGKKLLFMGQEWGQNDEWSSEAGLQWYLTDYDEHKGVQAAIADINKQYRAHPALFEKDVHPDGFQWIVGDDGERNVVAFTRWSDNGTPLVSITNFSPSVHEGYSMRMPTSGVWREVLNTDDMQYGGSGVSNHSFAVDVDTDLYAQLRIPPLATIWLERA
jgi:1,4-alpha-glucan branching enzyme